MNRLLLKKSSSLFFLLTFFFSIGLKAQTKNIPNNDLKFLTENEKNTISIFQESVNSVVNVSNVQIAKSFWDYGEVEVPAGAGSGFIWDDQGHIVTNFHVVQGGDSFLISFHKDPKQYKAKLIGAEPRQDIAVLKLIEGPNKLFPLSKGSSSNLMVGQKALAIGNPYGLDHTLTAGIISALDRKIDGIGGVKIHGMIQTDASINPGNSGGPLINSSGDLIGMNTVIISKSGSSSGVGFAVPVNIINRIVPQIIKYKKVTRPGLGIGIAPDNIKYRFGLQEGIVISYIDPKGPAAKAGLKGMSQDKYGRIYLGDTIVSINGNKINNYDDIYHLLDNFKGGDLVDVGYLRNDKILKVKIKLIEI